MYRLRLEPGKGSIVKRRADNSTRDDGSVSHFVDPMLQYCLRARRWLNVEAGTNHLVAEDRFPAFTFSLGSYHAIIPVHDCLAAPVSLGCSLKRVQPLAFLVGTRPKSSGCRAYTISPGKFFPCSEWARPASSHLEERLYPPSNLGTWNELEINKK